MKNYYLITFVNQEKGEDMACKVFKSASYSSKMLQNLYDLWQAECFCDVEIVCDDEVFKVQQASCRLTNFGVENIFLNQITKLSNSLFNVGVILCSRSIA